MKMTKNKKITRPNIEKIKQFVNGKTIEEMANYNIRHECKELKEIDGITGFKEYKIRNKINRKADRSINFDCDSCELIMSIWCMLLEETAIVKEVKGYQNRIIHYVDINGKEREVETDTINSLETSLNKFIREVIERKFGRKWHKLYENGYGIESGEIKPDLVPVEKRNQNDVNRDTWFVQYYDEILNEDTLTTAEIKTLEQLEIWSNSIHTIGDMMIGPVNFNIEKAKNINNDEDRLDLFFEKVKNNADFIEWREQFSSLMDMNHLDLYFIGDKFTSWESAALKNLRKNENYEWMKEINHLIYLRGLALSKRLKEMIDNL